MSRPKGSKSNYTKRNNLNYKDIKNLLFDYGNLTIKELLEKYNISRSQLRNIRNEYKIKSKQVSNILGKKLDPKDILSKNIVSGVYIISRSDFRKIYIGSSIDIYNRIRTHIQNLELNKHCNINMQSDFNKGELFYFFISKQCEEKDLLNIENDIISSLNDGILYNKVIHDGAMDVDDLFNKIKHKIIKDSFGCWLWTGKKNKEGYGCVKHKDKHMLSHRIFYIYYTKQYPYIVHHKCHNKSCCNPDHLESVSSSSNCKQKNNDLFLKQSKLFKYKDDIVRLRKNGHSFRSIKNELNIDADITTIFQYCKKLKSVGLL